MQKRLFCVFLLSSIIFIFLSIEFSTYAQDNSFYIEWDNIPVDSYQGLSWSPDGTHIAFGNSSGNQVLILDFKTQKISDHIDLPGNSETDYFALQWSSDGIYLAVVSSPKVYVFNTENGNLVQTYSDFSKQNEKSQVTDAKWVDGSGTLAVLDASGYINLFDILTGETIKLIDLGEHGEGIVYSAFDWSTVAGLFAAPLYGTGTLGFWEPNGEIVTTLVKPDPNIQNQLSSDCRIPTLGLGVNNITSVRWANEGRRLAIAAELGVMVCTFDDQMKAMTAIDISVVEETDTLPYPAPYLVTWSPDGQWLLTNSYPGPDYCWVKVFDSTQGYELSQTLEGKICSIRDWQWSPDGMHLAAIAHEGLWIGSVQ